MRYEKRNPQRDAVSSRALWLENQIEGAALQIQALREIWRNEPGKRKSTKAEAKAIMREQSNMEFELNSLKAWLWHNPAKYREMPIASAERAKNEREYRERVHR